MYDEYDANCIHLQHHCRTNEAAKMRFKIMCTPFSVLNLVLKIIIVWEKVSKLHFLAEYA